MKHAFKEKIVSFLTLAFFFNSAYSQANAVSPVRVGEKVPDVLLTKIINYKTSVARLSDLYKGKLLILDFWSDWCTVCIEQFPRLYELQQKFPDKILILPVGVDTYHEGNIEAFINRRKGTTRQMLLPSAVLGTHDTLLLQLFPYTGLPAEVWIDPNGIFRAITDHKSVTENNVKRMLEHVDIGLPVKKITTRIRPSDNFIIPAHVAGAKLTFGSAVTGYLDTVSSSIPFGKQFDSSFTRLLAVNQDIFSLYTWTAYGDAIDNDSKRIITVGRASNLFAKPAVGAKLDTWEYDKFKRDNLFCYEATLPNIYTVPNAKRLMAHDLDRYFNISSHVEQRTVNCLSLIRISSVDKIHSSSTLPSEISEDQLDEKLRGVFIKTVLLNQLNYLLPNDIIIDETGYKNKIDINIQLTKNYSIADIRNILQHYGLGLVRSRTYLKVLVLK